MFYFNDRILKTSKYTIDVVYFCLEFGRSALDCLKKHPSEVILTQELAEKYVKSILNYFKSDDDTMHSPKKLKKSFDQSTEDFRNQEKSLPRSRSRSCDLEEVTKTEIARNTEKMIVNSYWVGEKDKLEVISPEIPSDILKLLSFCACWLLNCPEIEKMKKYLLQQIPLSEVISGPIKIYDSIFPLKLIFTIAKRSQNWIVVGRIVKLLTDIRDICPENLPSLINTKTVVIWLLNSEVLLLKTAKLVKLAEIENLYQETIKFHVNLLSTGFQQGTKLIYDILFIHACWLEFLPDSPEDIIELNVSNLMILWKNLILVISKSITAFFQDKMKGKALQQYSILFDLILKLILTFQARSCISANIEKFLTSDEILFAIEGARLLWIPSVTSVEVLGLYQPLSKAAHSAIIEEIKIHATVIPQCCFKEYSLLNSLSQIFLIGLSRFNGNTHFISKIEFLVKYLLILIEYGKSTNHDLRQLAARFLAALVREYDSVLQSNQEEIFNILKTSIDTIFCDFFRIIKYSNNNIFDFYKTYFTLEGGALWHHKAEIEKIMSSKAFEYNKLLQFKCKLLAEESPKHKSIGSIISAIHLKIKEMKENSANKSQKMEAFKDQSYKEKSTLVKAELDAQLKEERFVYLTIKITITLIMILQIIYSESETLINLELHQNKMERAYNRLCKRLLQHGGLWRNSQLLTTAYPQKLSSHQFQNQIKCIMKPRNKQNEFLFSKKDPSEYVEKFKDPSIFFDLSQIVQCEPRKAQCLHSHYLLARNVLKYQNFHDSILQFLIKSFISKSAFPDLILPAPLPCEIYTTLLSYKGQILLSLQKEKKNIIFIYEKPHSLAEDSRHFFGPAAKTRKRQYAKLDIQYIYRIVKKTIVEKRSGLEIVMSCYVNGLWCLEFGKDTSQYSSFFWVSSGVMTYGKSILFNFCSEEGRDNFCNKLLKIREKLYAINDDNCDPIKSLTRLTEDWVKWRMSTLDYLMAVNCAGSRSVHNLSQYPIFPWVIIDMESPEISLEDRKVYRNLRKNIAMCGTSSRIKSAQERFEKGDLTELGAFHHGSFLSNPGIMLQNFTRIYPFFEGYVKFFAGMDDPNRMFHSFSEQLNCVLKHDGDIRELLLIILKQ